MIEPILDEKFDRPALDAHLHWRCAPTRWSSGNGLLVVEPDAGTDFWQNTHYGFAADNGHFLHMGVPGDFVLTTRLRFHPASQYDQAGLMVRHSAGCWLKTSVEFELEGPSKLGAVVTNRGYSDWSTQDFPPGVNEVSLRVRREGDDFIVETSTETSALPLGERWTQIRLAHLLLPRPTPSRALLRCGLYACSPKGKGYRAEFEYLKVEHGRLSLPPP